MPSKRKRTALEFWLKTRGFDLVQPLTPGHGMDTPFPVKCHDGHESMFTPRDWMDRSPIACKRCAARRLAITSAVMLPADVLLNLVASSFFLYPVPAITATISSVFTMITISILILPLLVRGHDKGREATESALVATLPAPPVPHQEAASSVVYVAIPPPCRCRDVPISIDDLRMQEPVAPVNAGPTRIADLEGVSFKACKRSRRKRSTPSPHGIKGKRIYRDPGSYKLPVKKVSSKKVGDHHSESNGERENHEAKVNRSQRAGSVMLVPEAQKKQGNTPRSPRRKEYNAAVLRATCLDLAEKGITTFDIGLFLQAFPGVEERKIRKMLMKLVRSGFLSVLSNGSSYIIS